MLNLLEQHDIVDDIYMTSHGDGLEEAWMLEVDKRTRCVCKYKPPPTLLMLELEC